MTMEEVVRDIQERPVVPIWPHLGMVLDMSRNGTYASAGREDFRREYGVISIGRNLKVVSATLRKRLQLAAA